MTDRARRKELVDQYKQSTPQAGVYRLLNTVTQRALIGSAHNLESVANKLRFAQTTHSAVALDYRLKDDIRQYGIDAFTLEVLETLETKPEMTAEEIGRDLAVLEALWRERFDPGLLY